MGGGAWWTMNTGLVCRSKLATAPPIITITTTHTIAAQVESLERRRRAKMSG